MPFVTPTLPPSADVLEIIQTRFLPAAGAAAVVFGIAALAGKRFRLPAAALGIVAGAVAGNWHNSPFPLEQWNSPSSPRFFLPHMAMVLLLVGVFASMWDDLTETCSKKTRVITVALGWVLRTIALAVAAYFVVPPDLGLPIAALFVSASLLLWFALDRVAVDGSGAEAGLIGYLGCATAGGVMLLAHYASFMDYAMILGAGFFGLAVVAVHGKLDLRGAVPAYVGMIPGLMVSGKQLTDSQVPPACFWIAALLPLVALPGLIPWVNRNLGRYGFLLRVGLVMIASAAVLGWAMQHEMLPWQEQW